MKLYRQFFLLPRKKRDRMAYGIALALFLFTFMFHQQIHYWWDINSQYTNVGNGLFSGDETSPQWFNQKFKYISAVTSEIDCTQIQINAKHEHIPTAKPSKHYSVAVVDLDHICVESDYKTQTVVIAVPQQNQDLHWALAYPEPTEIDYDSYLTKLNTSLEDVVQHCSSSQTATANDQSFGKVAIAWLETDNKPFTTELNSRLGNYWFWSNADTYAHKPYLTIPLALLLYGFLFRWLIQPGPLALLICKQMSSFKLEDEEILKQLLNRFADDWLNSRPTRQLSRDIKAECRKIQREQKNKSRLERREAQLSKLVGPARSEKLRTRISKRARRARRRIRENRSTVSQEIEGLRQELESEQSGVARILESGIVEALQTDSPEDPIDPEEIKRDQLIERVWSCNFDLTGVEDMELTDLERLANILRDIKRGIDKQAWKKLVQEFDGNKPKTYRRILKLAEAKEYGLLETLLLNRPQTLHQSAEIEIRTEELLLLGKSVIIIGGLQGLGPLYCEGILSLGATSATYYSEDETSRLKEAAADLALIFFRQVPHRQQEIVESKKIPIVFLDKRSKSTFLKGAVKMITVQL